jgi:tripartite-type tricarboxylate transporter receptor subunit TctC
MKVRRLLAMCAAPAVIAMVLCGAGAARADWPDRPVRWVVPFGPGGANDLIARAAAEAVSKRLGQPVVIENKPGAGAIVGAEVVAKAKPDGYTWLVGAAGVVTRHARPTSSQRPLRSERNSASIVRMLAMASSTP